MPANYTSWGQRKALGRRYSIDPALEMEKERLANEYALIPGREQRALQKRQLDMQEEAIKQQEKSGMVQTGIGLVRDYYSMKKLFGNNNQAPPPTQPTPTGGVVNSGEIGADVYSQGNPYTAEVIRPALTEATGTGQGISLGGNASVAVDPALVDAGATGAAGLGAGAGTGAGTASSVAPLSSYTLGGNAGASATTYGAQSAGTTLGGVLGGVATGLGYAALGSAGRVALGSIFANQSNDVLKTQGEYMLAEPTFEGLSNRVMTDVFAGGKKWIREDAEPWLDPAGTILKKAGCIIVTACTNRTSYEVEITRQYRDKFLDDDQLRGYYKLADKIVPSMKKNAELTKFIKKNLVDYLIDYGECKLGLKGKCKLSSKIISKLFLGLIKTIGFLSLEYVRSNGEVY